MFKRLLATALLVSACRTGAIDDPRPWVPSRSHADPQSPDVRPSAGSTRRGAAGALAWPYAGTAGAPALHRSAAGAPAPTSAFEAQTAPITGASEHSDNASAAGAPAAPAAGSGGAAGASSPPLPAGIGSGELTRPVAGPAPSVAAKLGGAPFSLVKNWDFGRADTLRDVAQLNAEFDYHDQFDTIANGTRYGAVTVAPDAAHAIAAPGLGLPGDRQPIEDPARPYREWTERSLKTYVRPLSPSQSSVTAPAHDAGCGSLNAKWKLSRGGAFLGRDLVWETRLRMPAPLPGYWLALWSAGDQWNEGAEMDVLASFGAANAGAKAFHVDAIGGTNAIDYSDWARGLTTAGVAQDARDLTQWHVWSWVYLRDDSYQVYFDGQLVQHGSIHWTNGGGERDTPIDLRFVFDLSWGHTQIADADISLPAAMFPLVYELDYSRVYLR